MKLTALFLVLAAGCAHAQASNHNLDTHDPVANALHFAVSLTDEAGRTFCSGAIVEHQILTAGHCVLGNRGGTLVKWMGKSYTPTGTSAWPAQDVAVLEVQGLPRGLSLAPAAPGYGAPIFTVGNPLGGLERSLHHGHVSHPRRADMDLGCGRFTCFPDPFMQFDALIAPGSSGSPVLDKVGGVVGVVSFTFGASGNLGGAVHLETLERFWKRVK